MRLKDLYKTKRKPWWPWANRKRLEREHQQQRAEERKRHERELEKERERVTALLKRFAEVRLRHIPDGHHHRIACEVSLDPLMVRELFIRGNDRGAFRWLAGHIGHMVERELHTINFSSLPQTDPEYSKWMSLIE